LSNVQIEDALHGFLIFGASKRKKDVVFLILWIRKFKVREKYILRR
jgi:hypothetical protein